MNMRVQNRANQKISLGAMMSKGPWEATAQTGMKATVQLLKVEVVK